MVSRECSVLVQDGLSLGSGWAKGGLRVGYNCKWAQGGLIVGSGWAKSGLRYAQGGLGGGGGAQGWLLEVLIGAKFQYELSLKHYQVFTALQRCERRQFPILRRGIQDFPFTSWQREDMRPEYFIQWPECITA